MSAPEEVSESGPTAALDDEEEGDTATAGASGRRHLSAKERKMMKKQVSKQADFSHLGLQNLHAEFVILTLIVTFGVCVRPGPEWYTCTAASK